MKIQIQFQAENGYIRMEMLATDFHCPQCGSKSILRRKKHKKLKGDEHLWAICINCEKSFNTEGWDSSGMYI